MKKSILIAGAVLATVGVLFFSIPKPVKAQAVCDATAVTGPYAYTLAGEVYDSQGYVYYLAANGILNGDGAGNFSGGDTLSLDGSISKRKYTGTYTINADCTGSAHMNISDGTSLGTGANYDLVLTDTGKQLNMIQTDSSFIFSGTAKKQ